MSRGPTDLDRVCVHCGAFDTTRIGDCDVCGEPVCVRCGNTQHARGERHVRHNVCVTKDDSSFTMIKFVK